MLVDARETVTVWTANGLPTRLVWHGQRQTVIDEPTRLADAWIWLTHVPPGAPDGWRLTARNESGETRVFDLIERSDGQFEVLHVYD